ncbi:MAG: hypothetical protein JRI23_32750 [Deltaproteobacteria bacterium]|nr:hypothetical protein [Deltaproteobacteria bacterium]MBW2537022.1 hypothetical protein [Deltaproteobacteria bacterium]
MGGAVKDAIVLGGLLLSFATLLTAHVAIAVRMMWRVRPRYRGLLALVVAPLAPLWAYEQRWKRLSLAWVGGLAAYVVFRVAAQF